MSGEASQKMGLQESKFFFILKVNGEGLCVLHLR